jgi:hypothetical protein
LAYVTITPGAVPPPVCNLTISPVNSTITRGPGQTQQQLTVREGGRGREGAGRGGREEGAARGRRATPSCSGLWLHRRRHVGRHRKRQHGDHLP